ncbi:hypothetical protein HF086_004167 [Spodoptera exigua]|uniref:Uncharacterized protein n=1 Tax=Spodoptera exigua TaxID=7107 RepID=A0A922SFS1_SPOEX|nr:hypothetical protein HF086_004167 [Spodoptera exigua]
MIDYCNKTLPTQHVVALVSVRYTWQQAYKSYIVALLSYRIGSARRVTEGAPLTNGEVERAKFPPRLLAGDGDPDFGTPV